MAAERRKERGRRGERKTESENVFVYPRSKRAEPEPETARQERSCLRPEDRVPISQPLIFIIILS